MCLDCGTQHRGVVHRASDVAFETLSSTYFHPLTYLAQHEISGGLLFGLSEGEIRQELHVEKLAVSSN